MRHAEFHLKKSPRVVISATHKSSGKTVTTVGLLAALREKTLNAQPFKKGPDYIDPMWLSAAAGKACHNLDYYMLGWKNIDKVFGTYAPDDGLSIVEGNKGLYDSVEVDGEGSTAALARRLKAPVILVVDASKITRGIAPLLVGYSSFEPDTKIAGVILNKVSSSRHEAKLCAVIEKYCDMPVLGAIRNTSEMTVLQRHLGLIPIKEENGLSNAVTSIKMQVQYSVDIDKVLDIAKSAEMLSSPMLEPSPLPVPSVKIGVVIDRAFTFYYPENLQALKEAGAELTPVDSLENSHLPPDIDALYIGGGFPETLMDKLEENISLRNEIKNAIENGLPVYAECGGLIYLAKSVSWKNQTSRMVGAINCDIVIRRKPKGHGYMLLEPTGNLGWLPRERSFRGHEFHYGEVVNLKEENFAYNVMRGNGINGKNDGIIHKNVVAGFAHLHSLGCPEWAAGFVSFAQKVAFSKRVFAKIGKDAVKIAG